ncbi:MULTISPECIES: Tn3 family transposase [Mesorhizobium]|uniref:Tn3 family transposase n=1 Tax=Mesorhizobium sp. AA22 TaxID=1854057 RepID=UPI000A6FB299|nr:transposase [Mesorhizobium sp. AA22]
MRAALQHRTADAESILRRFARASVQRQSYKALAQLGRQSRPFFSPLSRLGSLPARNPRSVAWQL